MIKKFIPFAQKRMGFNKAPRLFIKQDVENSDDPLGKTAFYEPNKHSITLYTVGRHPKDVMRSLSHELVHHAQNCRGEFNGDSEMGEGYAQADEHLREMEREAYEVGNMCFRDWEDSIKSTIYFEHLQKGDNKMSIKDWKNNELTTILSEAWGFKFNSLQEFEKFDGTGEIQEEETVELKSPAAEEEADEAAEANLGEAEEAVEETIDEAEEESGEPVEEEVTTEDSNDINEEEDIEEGAAAARKGNEDKDVGRNRMHADRVHEADKAEALKEAIKAVLNKHIKG